MGQTCRLLQIDLTRGTYDVSNIEDSDINIGGRSYASEFLFNQIKPEVGPLEPENMLIFSTGSMTGTLFPASSRLLITTKSAITGGYGATNVGGFLAPEIKYSGFDHIAIKGSAEKPVYLAILEGKVQIKSAEHLWGKTTWETEDLIRKELRNPNIRIASIGQGGENKCKSACIIVDKGRAAAWAGCGAIMGSKNLKAIAVKGDGKVRVAHPDLFLEEVRNAWNVIHNSKPMQQVTRYGTIGVSGGDGLLTGRPQGVKNLSDGQWDGFKTSGLKDVVFREKFPGPYYACFGCPTPCSQSFGVPNSVDSQDRCLAIHSNHIRGFGSNLDIDKPEMILRASSLVSQYGLNVDEVSATIAWAFEAWEKGIINKEDTGGLVLGWGQGDSFLELIRQMAHREGFGDVLADGVAEASKRIGRGAEELAVTIKNAGINERGLREYIGWALGVATSVRGGGHLNGAPLSENRSKPRELSKKLYGIETAFESSSYSEKEKLVTQFNYLKVVIDSLGTCWFHSICYDDNFYKHEEFARAYNALTGKSLSKDDLIKIGERTLNIEKAFNVLHAGFRREDDILPRRFYEDPVSFGQFKGATLDYDKWDALISRFYKLQGWDEETGWQTLSGLKRLGLNDVAKALDARGRLIK